MAHSCPFRRYSAHAIPLSFTNYVVFKVQLKAHIFGELTITLICVEFPFAKRLLTCAAINYCACAWLVPTTSTPVSAQQDLSVWVCKGWALTLLRDQTNRLNKGVREAKHWNGRTNINSDLCWTKKCHFYLLPLGEKTKIQHDRTEMNKKNRNWFCLKSNT